jgi:glutaredoxin
MAKKVRMWALSTCGWCKKTKRFLEDHDVEYECTDVDLLDTEAKQAAREELTRYNPKRSYPTVVVGEAVVRGYDTKRLRELLDL